MPLTDGPLTEGPLTEGPQFDVNTRPFPLFPFTQASAEITGFADDVGLIQGQVANGGTTDDPTPTISGVLSRALAPGETLRIFNGTTFLGNATVNNILSLVTPDRLQANTWSFTPTFAATAGTNYSITARVADTAGNLGTASAARTFRLDTTKRVTLSSSSNKNINDLWLTNGSNPINYNKFIGLASDGFRVYDTGVNGTNLPAYYPINRDFKSVVVLGFGNGVGLNANLRAGIDFKLKADLGSADLALNDSINWEWTKNANNIILSSSYEKSNSSLLVKGASLNVDLTGRGDIDANVSLLYKLPSRAWNGQPIRSIKNTSPLFQESFNSKQPRSINLFNGAATINYSGLNLDTASNAQLANGVKSSANSALLGVTLDIDNLIGKYVGLPNGLNFSWSEKFGALSASASLDLLNITLGAKTSLAQEITAKLDVITGSLILENGSSINYKVGDSIILPLSTYDQNNDGKLDLKFEYTKQGTLANKTDLVLNTSAGAALFSGNVSGNATIKLPFNLKLSYSKSYGFGPLASADWPITSNTFNLFDKSWAANSRRWFQPTCSGLNPHLKRPSGRIRSRWSCSASNGMQSPITSSLHSYRPPAIPKFALVLTTSKLFYSGKQCINLALA
jgi:hypothetical protein